CLHRFTHVNLTLIISTLSHTIIPYISFKAHSFHSQFFTLFLCDEYNHITQLVPYPSFHIDSIFPHSLMLLLIYPDWYSPHIYQYFSHVQIHTLHNMLSHHYHDTYMFLVTSSHFYWEYLLLYLLALLHKPLLFLLIKHK